ncbi:hypothetical protein Cci01nite_04240 [Catellatospora citrea]|uniref:Uncharacterized protein n=1 Tax=Catellatospora citrea TaxID=53366 RepID=A0A8J3NYH1_9ACTN|nr:hypothetical protein [Catellatospora citrea]RKE07178.1 hypothetical protein C8E86_2003 [Catellatospora citrea]GIF95330.1 hypothetical protein Cci01nite_04240 [Catellatospora citrea]
MDISPGTAREEAERLVAAVLAAATLAANANPHLATGSPECCVCPLCKVIAAVRDPDPELVERVATGAGDLAAGLASFLRSVSTHRPGDAAWRDATAHPGTHAEGEAAGRRGAEGDGTGPAGAAPAAASADAPPARPMAKKAVKKMVKKVVTNPTPSVSESETPPSPARVKAAKKAVRKAEPHPPPEL